MVVSYSNIPHYGASSLAQGGTIAKPDYQLETASACARGNSAAREHISRLLARIGDKWSMLAVCVLGRGPCRFNALRREIGEVSQKVLASTLRELEQYGFVSRTVMPTNPPQVEYALTDLGYEFLEPVTALAEWVMQNSPRMDAARVAFAVNRAAE